MSQDVIALTLVALASVYLSYRLFGSLLPGRLASKSTACASGCGSCPANATHASPTSSQTLIRPGELTILKH